MDFLNDAIRTLGALISWGIYSLISWILQGIFDLANSQIFSQTVIDDFARRLYVILGLVMVFKILISFLQILINPDIINDKEKGAGGVLKRVIIALLMIVFVPTIFKTARQLQQYIMPIIPKVLLGVPEIGSDNSDTNDDFYDKDRIGSTMAWYAFAPFFQYENASCVDGSLEGGMYDLEKTENISGRSIRTVKDAYDARLVRCESSTLSPKYRYEFKIILSILVGGYLVYVLVNVAVKIAVRTIKLSICEFASPIPIASYIDPKTSEKTFKKWLKMSINLYLELYIHLITVYFVIYVFITFTESESLLNLYYNLDGNFRRICLVTIFFITGLLTFAKDAPKFLSDLLGIDTSGAFGSIFKPDGWKALGTTATTLANPVLTAIANGKAATDNDFGTVRAARSIVGGFASSAFHGTKAALKGENAKGILKAGHSRAVTARQNRTLDAANGINFMDRFDVIKKDFMGWDSDASLADTTQKSYSTLHSDTGAIKSAIQGRVLKNATVAIRQDGEARSQLFKKLVSSSEDILNSGNAELISYLKKVADIDSSTGKYVLKSEDELKDVRIGYHDLVGLAKDAEVAGISTLSTNIGVIKTLAEKEIYDDTIAGKVIDTLGETIEEFDVKGGTAHSDIMTAVGIMKQHLTENAVSLQSLLKPGEENLISVFENKLTTLDDRGQKASAALSTVISADREAKARASINRRKQNK